MDKRIDVFFTQKDFSKITKDAISSDSWEAHMISSPLRESTLNWYEFRKEASLLELNAGHGQLTGLFCRRLAEVTTVTNKKRADFVGRRYETKANLRIVTELPEQTKKYDYVIARDILEEAGNTSETIQQWMGYLKKGGILILFCENRFGLKYFCGAKDPHTDKAFDGINGYLKNDNKGRCLSHAELSKAIAENTNNFKFYYPVPDSRMPQMIFTDKYQKSINVAERLVDYDYQDQNIFGVEHRIFREMIDQGGLAFMANSFLVEITKDGILSDIDYAVTTTDRGPVQGMATSIRDNATVIKRPLWPEGEMKLRELSEKTKELRNKGIPVVSAELSNDEYGIALRMPYIEAEGLSSVLTAMAEKDEESFLKLFDDIHTYNKLASDNEKAYVDLAPCNCFYTPEDNDNQILFYDQEFTLNAATVEFAMYRTLKYFYASAISVEAYIPFSNMLTRYQINQEDIDKYEKIEQAFIESVRHTDQYSQMFKWATPDYDLIYEKQKVINNAKDINKKQYHIGYVPGVFDLFHTGHLILLERCKERCDYLIVGVLTDGLVEYYKGYGTIISYENRARVIEALSVVDEVIPVDFSNTDKLDAWEQLHYDCHFSGDDHINHWNDVWEELKRRGSNMEFFSYTEGISSSQIRKDIENYQN